MSAIKALQQWCRVQCQGYRDVSITNMTTSFRDGLAFCALIHKHRPDLINFDSLKKENVYENNKLAFRVAEQELGIPALLDAEDMVALKVPDRLSILTYVSQYYNYFHGRSPIGGMGGMKRPAEGPADEPTGKKNQAVTSKVFASSKPARENSPPPSFNITRPSPSPKQARYSTQDVLGDRSHQTGTLSNKCVSCNKHVHLVQRQLVDGRLYHRNCAKLLSPTNTSTPLRDLPTNTQVSRFTPLPEPSKPNTTTNTQVSRFAYLSDSSKPSTTTTTTTTTQVSRFTPQPEPSKPNTTTNTQVSRFAYLSDSSKPNTTTTTTTNTQVSRFTPQPEPSKPNTTTNTQASRFAYLSDSSKPNTTTTTNTHVSRFTPQPEPSKPNTTTNTQASRFAYISDSSKPNTTTNTHVSRFTPLPDSSKPNKATSPLKPPRLGPTWLTDKPSTPPSVSTTFYTSSPSRPSPGLSSAAKESPTAFVSKPTASPDTTFTMTTSISTGPTPAPRTSAAVAKTMQSKLKFFESDNTTKEEEKRTTTINVDINKGPSVSGKTEEATAGQAVTLVVNVGGIGRKEANESLDKAGDRAKATAVGWKVSSKQEDGESNKTKASAAAFISKKLAEENSNNNNKPSWTTVALKKIDKPQSQVETPKRETEGVRGRVKLKADPSLLADLRPPDPSSNSAPSPAAGRSGLRARTPERGGPKPGSASPNSSVSENESPADWRSMLKPVSKETRPAGPSQSSPKLWPKGAGKSSELSVGPSSSHLPSPSIFVNPPASKGIQNGQKEQTANGTKSESKVSKTNPDYIPKEDIVKELQEIEDNLNELEKRGVELEMRLRSSEEEGEDDSLMDELMVEWFNLIRNKQVAMRRESELVYIGKTQDLEEQQPSVEQELRRLIEKPERLKTAWDRRREAQLMAKLVEIVNDRNAIVEGLDEDRLREEEEDEELNKMMMNFNIKKDKAKKKSPVSKLFSWGNKKEG